MKPDAASICVKNMVCQRCIWVVKKILNGLDIPFRHVKLGLVALYDPLDAQTALIFKERLEEQGFEWVVSRQARQIERIKSVVISWIYDQPESFSERLSDRIANSLHQDYGSLSSLFSSVEGITIEKYAIEQRIEKAKELLFYDELNLSEIAYRLGYSSLQHLSSQFKKVTGMTPSQYKRLADKPRKPLDKVGR